MADDTEDWRGQEARILGFWREGEVWFRDFIPAGRPWSDEGLLRPVPEEAQGSYGIVSEHIVSEQYVTLDGIRYEPGNFIMVDSREELGELLVEVPKASGLVLPWYDRVVPASLWLPYFSQIDLASYRKRVGASWIRAFAITAGLAAVAFLIPSLLIFALLLAVIYGLYPLVDATMSWFERVDRQSAEDLNRRVVNHELFHRWITGRPTTVLKGFLGILILVFVGQMLVDGGTPPGTLPDSIRAAALVKTAVLQDAEWWRLLTTGLMHGHIFHILFNGMALFSLGRVVAALVSPARLSIVFVLTVLTGSAASLWLGHAPASVGASGGILGCLGFLLVVTRRFREELPDYLRSSLIQSTIVVSIFGLLGKDFIDNAAHAGGFLGGVLIGIAGYRRLRLAPSRSRASTLFAGWVCNALLLAGVIKVAWELYQIR